MVRIDSGTVRVALDTIPYMSIKPCLDFEGGSIKNNDNKKGITEIIEEKNNEAEVDDTKKYCDSLVDSAHKTAEEILDNAETEANKLIETAKQKVDSIISEAKQKGYNDGKQQADADASEEANRAAVELTSLILEIQNSQDKLIDDLESKILRLSLDVAEKIVNTTLDENKSDYISFVKNSVSRIKGENKIVVKLNEKQFDKYFSDETADILKDNSLQEVMVISDDTLNPGGCIVECNGEIINSSVSIQLKNVKKTLLRHNKQ